MLISPLSPFDPGVTFLPAFFGLVGRLLPASADADADADAELAGRVECDGTRDGGGMASDADDAVLDTVAPAPGCLKPVVVGRRDMAAVIV